MFLMRRKMLFCFSIPFNVCLLRHSIVVMVTRLTQTTAALMFMNLNVFKLISFVVVASSTRREVLRKLKRIWVYRKLKTISRQRRVINKHRDEFKLFLRDYVTVIFLYFKPQNTANLTCIYCQLSLV